MTVPVRLTDLRDRMDVSDDELLALLDAVEAAHHVVAWIGYAAEYADAETIKEHDEDFIRLEHALAGFDFTADQPTTTKGET